MTILDFKNIYKGYSPCADGADEFDRATSRKEVFSVMTNPSYYDFLFRSILRGWGPKPEDIMEIFSPYINGHEEIHTVNGLECKEMMICGKVEKFAVPSGVRIVFLVGFEGEVVVGDWDTVKIVADKHSVVEVTSGSNSLAYVENYGGRIEPRTGNIYIRKKV